MDTDEPALGNGTADGEISPDCKLNEPTPMQTLANGNEEMQAENHSNGEIDLEVQGNNQNSIRPNSSTNEENNKEG
jgi:hypothetical protein